MLRITSGFGGAILVEGYKYSETQRLIIGWLEMLGFTLAIHKTML